MKSVEQMQAEIAKLQEDIEKRLSVERDAVIDRCLEAMKTYRIGWKDLMGRKKSKPEAAAQTARSLAMRTRVKYRLGEETWSGYGKHPQWVKEYLKKKSNKLEKLLVAPEESNP